MTAISVVIPTRGRPDDIGRSVRGVLSNDHPDFEVIVVDQSDDDRTGAVVRALAGTDPRLRYVHTMPPGLSRAYNIGVRMAAAQLLAFTDDDCVAAADWLSSIERTFAVEPDAEMLYGAVVRPSALPAGLGVVPGLAIAKAERIDRRTGFRLYGMGANFALRRAFFDRIGGFDEILGGGGPLRSSQDFDLQYRAYLARAVVLLRPEVTVDHYGLRNEAEWTRTERAYGVGDASFYLKHIRCGDLFAASLLIRRVGRQVARELLHLIGLREHSHAAYLFAYLEGLRESLGYPVDRERRLYRPRSVAKTARRLA
jgi:glycosyltransferase involved in cell wall biosynthesis